MVQLLGFALHGPVSPEKDSQTLAPCAGFQRIRQAEMYLPNPRRLAGARCSCR